MGTQTETNQRRQKNLLVGLWESHWRALQQTSAVLCRMRAGNSIPQVKDATLTTVRAGTAITYTLTELQRALAASDDNAGDIIKLSGVKLRTHGLGDKVTKVDGSKPSYRYFCPSSAECAVKGGNTLLVNVTDGKATVTGRLKQPVQPRPSEWSAGI
jgi:hypothetical protein